jgi:hypothetical protein
MRLTLSNLIDVALAAVLPQGNVIERRSTRLDLGQPSAPARNRGHEFGPGL